jgi:hypothetical protein
VFLHQKRKEKTLADRVPTMDFTVEWESDSDVEEQSRTWQTDHLVAPRFADDASSAHPHSDCGIGHRVVASRSVLALVLDEECVFAGLQGGDIVVSQLLFLRFCIIYGHLFSSRIFLTTSPGVVP